MDTSRFVRTAHGHILSKLSGMSLNVYYYALPYVHNGSGNCMVNILPLFSVLVGVPSAIYLFRLATGAGIRNRQSRRLPLGWCAMPWEPLAWTGRCSFYATSGIPKGVLQALWMSIRTLTLSAVPGLTLSCMTFRPGA